MLVYVYLVEPDAEGNYPPIARTKEFCESDGQINVDLAADDSIIGIEFLDAKRITSEAAPQ